LRQSPEEMNLHGERSVRFQVAHIDWEDVFVLVSLANVLGVFVVVERLVEDSFAFFFFDQFGFLDSVALENYETGESVTFQCGDYCF